MPVMKTSQLTDEQKRVLRDIHQRGVLVEWSYRIPYPYYDDNNEAVFAGDWEIIQSMWREESRSETVIVDPATYIRRTVVRADYFQCDETAVSYPGGKEMVRIHHITIPYADQIPEAYREKLNGYRLFIQPEMDDFIADFPITRTLKEHITPSRSETFQHQVDISEWLIKEDVEIEEDHVTIRYRLNDAALEAIGIQS